MRGAIALAERGWIPESLIRVGIRRILAERLQTLSPATTQDWIARMRASEVAEATEAANEQHYEVPPAFYELVLGPHLKYSSAYWPRGVETLAHAEAAMLELTCRRAQLADGQRILELGCGWGSLTLWMAAQYPRAEVVAVSNSASQGAFIRARAAERGLTNVQVHTADMNVFAPEGRFDRVVSVEMFEHMRNWEQLLGRVRGWLEDDGKLFLHVFAHVEHSYPYEDEADDDWMARHFFTGGIMPSHDLLEQLDVPFTRDTSWQVPGTHYARTLRAWLRTMERRRAEVLPVLAETYGARDAERWFHRWRLFFLACEELFAWDEGRQWIVSHHLYAPAPVPARSESRQLVNSSR